MNLLDKLKWKFRRQYQRLYNWLEWRFSDERHNPWRCEECGSLAVQEHIWVDANTREEGTLAYNREENYCTDCNAHTYHIRENELLKNIRTWFDTASIHCLEKVSGLSAADFDDEVSFRKACSAFWEGLTTNDKIKIWNENN